MNWICGKIKEIFPFLQPEECRRIGIYIGNLHDKQKSNADIMNASPEVHLSFLVKKKTIEQEKISGFV